MAESRYKKDLELRLPSDEVEAQVRSFMQRMNFYPTVWNGENCFCADRMPAERLYFFQYTYADGILHIEAWLRNGKTKELGLTGYVAAMQKEPYLNSIVELENRLINMLPEDSGLRQKNMEQIHNFTKSVSKQRIWIGIIMGILMVLLLVLGNISYFLK